MKRRLRVLLVDDQEVVRHGLRRMLEAEEDMDIVGACATAEEAFSHVGKLSPDIVLMDAQMPGMNGIEATRHLKSSGLDCDVIVLANSADYLVKALQAGAAGFLNKSVKREELADSVRQVYRSEHSPEERNAAVEEAVELVISPPAGAAQILAFAGQVEKRLGASVLQTVGSWDGGTSITILLKRDALSNLVDKLSNMDEVEKVKEGTSTRDGGLSSFVKKFRSLSSSRTSPVQRIVVTLRQDESQAGAATQRMAAAFNWHKAT